MKKILIPICILMLAGCYYDKEDQLYPKPTTATQCDTTNMTFTKDIQPIFNQSCAQAGCHDATTQSYGYDFSTYDGAKLSVSLGRLVGCIQHDNGYLPMPKNLPMLGDCEIAKIKAWVNAGTPQ